LNRIPEVPPTSAYDPSGFQETVQKLNPVAIPVGMVVRVAPSNLRRTAKSPDISAYDPSGFQATDRNGVVTG